MLLTLRTRSLRSATPRARIVQLDLDGAAFPFKAGQAALLGRAGQRLRRPYSIASAPEDAVSGRYLEFLVQVEADGQVGPHLTGLSRGTMVEVEGPVGRFHFPDHPAERRFLFVGGGTGIAPLRAMLRHALARHVGRLAMVYSARAASELAYAPELRKLARAGAITLTLTTTREPSRGWRGHRGRIGRVHLEPLIADPKTLCFVCGPPSLVRDVPVLLHDLGIGTHRILVDDW